MVTSAPPVDTCTSSTELKSMTNGTAVREVVAIDAVHEPSPLPAPGASREHAGLLAVMGAPDVLPVAGDARRLRQHLEHIPRRRNRLELLDVEARSLRRAPHIDDRADAGDDDVLLQAADGEFAVDLRVEAGLQLESFAHQRRKAREFELDRRIPRSEVRRTRRCRFHR